MPRLTMTYLAAAGLVAAAIGPAACESSSGRIKPLVSQPAWVRPTSIVLNVEQPEDRNSDGYDDTIFVTVYVFDADFRSQSIRVEGTYVFALVDADGLVALDWEVPPEVVRDGYRIEAPGPMLRLRLTIPQDRVMELGGYPFTLLARLTTSDGQVIESSGGSSFSLRQKGR
ncbi:MAG: hypothetical protein KF787_06220 [Phycisphaeraceae bacterium]|nr:hypothetical protein [Phycisphaerae bacterium]MBX3392226.1 hypothetical protein [Phycisphaeraceae bacterium]